MRKLKVSERGVEEQKNISLIKGLLVLSCWVLMSLSSAHATALKNIQFSGLPGNKVQVELVLDSAPEQLKSFSTDNPARIAVDLMGVSNEAGKATIPVDIGKAVSIRALEAGGRTRVVVNLDAATPYSTRIEGHSVFLTLGLVNASTEAVAERPIVSNKAAVTGIDFRRGEEGEGRVLVNLSDPSSIVDVKQEGDKVIVDIKGVSLADELGNRLDVLDFATPVKTIDVTSISDGVRLSIIPMGAYEFLSYQADKLLVVEFKPLTPQKQQELASEKFPYTGEKLSLNFQSIEVRSVLQLLADFTDRNLVASDSVGGSVTLRLNNVPWDQALDIILKSKGLAKRISGNVMMVGPQAEVAAQEKLELEAKKQVVELSPLRTEFFEVSFAKAADIEQLLVSRGGAGGQSNNASLISNRGSVATDLRTNTLIVQETAEKLSEIRRLIMRLDRPVRQVMVEARIVIANEDFTRNLGVNLGVSGVDYQNADDVRNIGEPVFRLNELSVDLTSNLASLAGASFTIGRIGGALLDLELTALQAEQKGEVISSPRVVTSDQVQAIISQGVQIPYKTVSDSGTETDFKDALLSLTVTPRITPDDKVDLEIIVTKDSVENPNAADPPINKQSVETTVLVGNGDTVILGGVYERINSEGVEKVPFFGDLPAVGVLFKNKSKTDIKKELLFFITPKILKDDLSVN
ncbi:MAG: type IV pilus secretin PilQ [Cycloclasticus sp.]